MSWSEIVVDVRANWWVYATMPVVAAFIGYVTKLLAVRMMFQPLEFRGIPPYLGWQGMLPRRSAKMAAIAYDMITGNLVDVQDVVRQIDRDEFVREVRGPIDITIRDLAEALLAQHQPGLWESMPAVARNLLIRRLQAQAPTVVGQLFDEVTRDIHEVLDVRHMVVTNLARDKALTNRLVKDIAGPEIAFLIRSGIWFGALIGLVQVVVWALTRNPLVMPLFGLLTGWITDYVALNMLFVPTRPRKILGITVHGLFLRRQHEVAASYGSLIATEILNPERLFEAMLTGPRSDRLVAMVHREVQRTIDGQSGLVKPLVVLVVGGKEYRDLKQAAADRLLEVAPVTARGMFAYAERALGVDVVIKEKMRLLSSAQFIRILRPAFKEDEKAAIAVGAILGAAMGELQAFLVIHLPTWF